MENISHCLPMYNIYGHAPTAVLYKHVLCPIKISLLTIGMDAFIGHHELLIFSLISRLHEYNKGIDKIC